MRVLIVDDDLDTAELTAECLMADGDFTVQIARNGESALRAVADFAPDTILLDVELREGSGLDLAIEIKVLSRGCARIVIFSGTVPKSDLGSLPPGVDAWLVKPVHLEEIRACIAAKLNSI